MYTITPERGPVVAAVLGSRACSSRTVYGGVREALRLFKKLQTHGAARVASPRSDQYADVASNGGRVAVTYYRRNAITRRNVYDARTLRVLLTCVYTARGVHLAAAE